MGRIFHAHTFPLLKELHASDFEAVVFPGGFGAAKNLSTFGVSSEPTVDDEVARVVREFRAASKPIAMCCIAPVIAALIIAKEDGEKVKVTLGKKGINNVHDTQALTLVISVCLNYLMSMFMHRAVLLGMRTAAG